MSWLAIGVKVRDLRATRALIVTSKLCRRFNFYQLVVIRIKGAGRTSTSTLLIHRRFKACPIHSYPAFTRDVSGQIHWKPISVVKFKRRFAAERVAIFQRL